MMRRTVLLVACAAILIGCGSSGEGSTTTHTHAAGQADHLHPMTDLVEASGPDFPTVELTVSADPVAGFNLNAVCENLTWAPEKAGLEHVNGEGHAHVYVDGEKVARIYGEWYHLTGLTPGTHQVKVTLNANTHAGYAMDGVEIADSVTIEVG